MSDFSTSAWPDWDTLTDTFKESFPALNQDVYEAAGEFWPKALSLAKSKGFDNSDARAMLLKVVRDVSRAVNEPNRDPIEMLPHYLSSAYERRIWKTLKEQKHHASLDEINQDLLSDTKTAEVIQKKVLLAELVARMDPAILSIYEQLILGYSFEEIARKEETRANVLRSRFSREVRRIAKAIKARE